MKKGKEAALTICGPAEREYLEWYRRHTDVQQSELCRNKGESHRTKVITVSAEMYRAYVNARVV
jgi:hypothetical protein